MQKQYNYKPNSLPATYNVAAKEVAKLSVGTLVCVLSLCLSENVYV